MRTRSIILIALAMGCGLVAAIGISQMMDARSKGEEVGERQPVFVALTDIRPNEELTAQNIKLEEWPKRIIPQGALTKLEEVEGKRTRLKVYAGEPILASKLLGEEDLTGAAREIPPGYRVAYVKVDPVSGSSNLIMPGDRVDVLVFRHPNNDVNALAAKIVLQDIKVFAVDTQTESEFTATKDEQTEPMTAKTISLLVTPQQAVVLHAATEMGGAVRLVLRNPEDDVHVADQGATIGDIFGHDTQKADRGSERATGSDSETSTSDITSWLTSEDNKQSEPSDATPLPDVPPAPGVPKRMLVVLGAELVEVDIPGTGGMPTVRTEGGPAELGGSQLGPSFGGEDDGPVVPPDTAPEEGAPSTDDSEDISS